MLGRTRGTPLSPLLPPLSPVMASQQASPQLVGAHEASFSAVSSPLRAFALPLNTAALRRADSPVVALVLGAVSSRVDQVRVRIITLPTSRIPTSWTSQVCDPFALAATMRRVWPRCPGSCVQQHAVFYFWNAATRQSAPRLPLSAELIVSRFAGFAICSVSRPCSWCLVSCALTAATVPHAGCVGGCGGGSSTASLPEVPTTESTTALIEMSDQESDSAAAPVAAEIPSAAAESPVSCRCCRRLSPIAPLPILRFAAFRVPDSGSLVDTGLGSAFWVTETGPGGTETFSPPWLAGPAAGDFFLAMSLATIEALMKSDQKGCFRDRGNPPFPPPFSLFF